MKVFPLDPRLPQINNETLRPLTARLVELFRLVGQRLNPSVYYGWRDMTASVSSARVPAASAPTLDNFGPSGTRTEYRFAVNDYIMIKPFHVNHDIRPTGSAYLHVHWSSNGTNVQPVKWQFEVMRAKGHQQEVFAAPTTITVTQTPAGVAWKHMIAEIADADALSMTEPDELFLVTLKRITNGGTDNTDKIFGLEVDFHYEADRDFTPFKSPDFY